MRKGQQTKRLVQTRVSLGFTQNPIGISVRSRLISEWNPVDPKVRYARGKNLPTTKLFQAKRRDLITQFKLERGCELCGYNDNACALDLDHRDPATKAFTISKHIQSVSLDRLLAELAKCRVVCANCHRVETFSKRQHLAWMETRT